MNSKQGSRFPVTSPEQARARGASAAQARRPSHSSGQGQGGLYAWAGDLEASRDVLEKDQASFAMVIGWMERFRSHACLAAGREACARFWKEQVLAKPREKWQTEQWAIAIRWYLRWLENRHESGGEVRTLEERVRMAVHKVGTRRGLAPRTRETYGQRVAAYARWVGDEKEVRDPKRARDFLSMLVLERRVSFSTQCQVLNALAFFSKTCAEWRKWIWR